MLKTDERQGVKKGSEEEWIMTAISRGGKETGKTQDTSGKKKKKVKKKKKIEKRVKKGGDNNNNNNNNPPAPLNP